MKSHLKSFVFLTLTVLLAACSVAPTNGVPPQVGPTSGAPTLGSSTPVAPTAVQGENHTNASAGLIQSSKGRTTAPQVPQSDAQTLAAGNNAFALDLYQKLNNGAAKDNIFFSPYSISLALAMTYGGAHGQTESQMSKVLHFTLTQDQLHPAFNALDQALASRKDNPSGGRGADGKGFRLNIVNDLWGEKDEQFLPAYLDLLSTNYGAGLRLMDFKMNPEGARQEINKYIAEKTEQRIKDLLPAGVIDPQTRLVLTNAIYYNAAWLFPFDEKGTKPAPFTKLDGSKSTVQMMNSSTAELLSYLKGTNFQAVDLPYENTDLSMLIVVPDEGKFADFASGLTADQLASIQKEMKSNSVRLHLPSFTFESQFSLAEQLKAMGMADAFSGQADFSGMDGTHSLSISDVIHKAFVKVNEAGTEAAAATAIVMRATSIQGDEPVNLVIDHPFIFMIVDHPTKTILFVGQVTDPGSK